MVLLKGLYSIWRTDYLRNDQTVFLFPIIPQPNLYFPNTTLCLLSLSILQRHIRILPSAWLTVNRDSSLKSYDCHWMQVKRKRRRPHKSLAAFRREVFNLSFILTTDTNRNIILSHMVNYRFGIYAVYKQLLCKWVNITKKSIRNAFSFARPSLWRSLTNPVVLKCDE